MSEEFLLEPIEIPEFDDIEAERRAVVEIDDFIVDQQDEIIMQPNFNNNIQPISENILLQVENNNYNNNALENNNNNNNNSENNNPNPNINNNNENKLCYPPETLDCRQTFSSKEEAREFLRHYGNRNGFTWLAGQAHNFQGTKIIDRFTYKCHQTTVLRNATNNKDKTSCSAHISFKLYKVLDDNGKEVENRYKINRDTLELGHNHALLTRNTGVIESADQFTTEQYEFIKDHVSIGTDSQAIRRLLINHREFNIKSISDPAFKHIITKARVSTGRGASEKELEQLVNYLTELRAKDEIFFETTSRGRSIEVLLFASPSMLFQFKRNNQAIILDCTYQTNRFDMVLLMIHVVDENNRTATVACALMGHDDIENNDWVLSKLKGWLGEEVFLQTRAIATDGLSVYSEPFFQKYFPNAKHLRCRWHIFNNIIDNCLARTSKETKERFRTRWHKLVDAETEIDFNREWHELLEEFKEFPEKQQYLTTNIYPIREKFVSAWTNQYMNLNNLTTGRSESLNSRLKSFDINSKSTLKTVLEEIMYVGSEQDRRRHEKLKAHLLKTKDYTMLQRKVATELSGFSTQIVLLEINKADMYTTRNISKRNQRETWEVEFMSIGLMAEAKKLLSPDPLEARKEKANRIVTI